MGKDIHYSIIKFFENKMREHSKVIYYEREETDENIIYVITRKFGMTPVKVLLSDAYVYTNHDYISKPPSINEGSFILIAKPENSFDGSEFYTSRQDKIGFGKIGIFLGALNFQNIWEYETNWEKEEKRKQGRAS